MDTEMLQPQERGDDKPLVTVHVGNTDMVDVIDDNSVINHVQRRRLAFIAEISPDGRIENKKDRHLYLQAMSDTAQSAQQRITSNNQQDDSARDRAVIAEVLAQMGGLGSNDTLPETGSIPEPAKRLSNRDIDPGILMKEVEQDTYNEFMERTAEKMIVDDDEE